MIDRILTRKSLVFMLITSIVLNIVRMATQITKMEAVDIDIALIIAIMCNLLLLHIMYAIQIKLSLTQNRIRTSSV